MHSKKFNATKQLIVFKVCLLFLLLLLLLLIIIIILEYQNSQRSVTTVQYKFDDICSDNIEYDGIVVHPSDTTGKSKPMLSVDRSEISRNRTPTLIIKSATIINQKQIRKNCFQTLFFKLILLFIIQILLSIACISIFYIYYHFSYNTNDG